jgi:hypothetical protein
VSKKKSVVRIIANFELVRFDSTFSSRASSRTADLPVPSVSEECTNVVTNAVCDFLVSEADVDTRLADKDRTQ